MNAENYTTTDWGTNIQAAQDAHIDAFTLNIASDPRIAQIMPKAFKVAASKGFKLFLSFDYAGNDAWGADKVAELLTIYTNLDAYYQHNGQNLVSTFEGSGSAEDWISIKEKYNVFFIPD
ncbi:unnamed protein product [Penicillium salamii]|uniref:Uncharacterized protein n=1 Tax=Penicillium salamii TaxID=1612424 RepID=A0A9W4NY08_9EURO|nr:unnamed protein product [Penicillium salamii]